LIQYHQFSGDRAAQNSNHISGASAVIIATSGVVAVGKPLKFSDIYVVDGDTIEALGKRIRLVGFDAPELGDHAHCGLERMLAARATSRLR
jgi:endonuclease YncB( thermonuclease family)